MKYAAIALAALFLFSACSNRSASTSATEAPSPAASAGQSPSEPANSSPQSGTSASPVAGISALTVSYDDLSGIFGEKEITQLAQLGVFGTPTGHFNPAKPVLRREFVRWLFKANNAIWANDPNNLIHPAQGESSSFTDVKATDPDFQYIQGLQDAGISVGFPDKTFRPDSAITHEQAVAIKSALDRGGVDKDFMITKTQPTYGYYNLPDWKDKHDISPEYVGAIATGEWDDRNKDHPEMRVDNVPRAFGAIAMFHPKASLTRGQAAIMLWKIGPHARAMRSEPARTAADALSPVSASPTP